MNNTDLFEILNELPSAVFIINKSHNILYFNKSFKSIFQTEESNIINQSCGNAIGCEFIINSGYQCGSTAECKKCEFRDNFILSFVTNTLTKSSLVRNFKIGNKFVKKYFQFVNKPLILNNEMVLLVVIDDVTELEEQKIELSHLLKLKNEFMQIAAHDIRNPLTVIYSYADYIINSFENLDSDKKINYLNIIKNSSKFSLELLNDLLDYSIIESGELKIKLKELDYIPFLKKVIEYNQIIAENKDIKINFFSIVQQLNILFDKDKIEQVINNIISNAIKFSSKHSKIDISIIINNNIVVTKIKDYGQGIVETEIKNLFKPFSKTSSKPTGGEKSTGLGLVISRKIIEAHKGCIWAESKINIGSEFIFTIPY